MMWTKVLITQFVNLRDWVGFPSYVVTRAELKRKVNYKESQRPEFINHMQQLVEFN